MNLKGFKVSLFLLFSLLLPASMNVLVAQRIQYSDKNVFINYPSHLQLISVGSKYHLVNFIQKENPALFIYNNNLELEQSIKIPFKFIDRSSVQIIPFVDFYYVYVHPPFTQAYLLWKVKADGTMIDLSTSFQQLLQSQLQHIKLSFQLLPYENDLWMIFHTGITDTEKSTLVMVQTDSLLHPVFSHSVKYDFNRDTEKLVQEVLIFGRYLLVLKTGHSGSSLEMMKINLATGFAITQSFFSDGFVHSQSSFNFNKVDSSITVSSLLSSSTEFGIPNRFIFLTRLNKILKEEVPVKTLKHLFAKKTNTNFLLIDGSSRWMRLKRSFGNVNADQQVELPDSIRTIRSSTSSVDEWGQDVRFSLFNKDFKVIDDSLISNAKNSYTLRADKFIRFSIDKKEYLLIGQKFVRKSNGLLLVHANTQQKLIYTDIRVNEKNDYLISEAQLVPGKGIVVPYIYKREAGIIRILID